MVSQSKSHPTGWLFFILEKSLKFMLQYIITFGRERKETIMKTIPYFCKEAALNAYEAEIGTKNVYLYVEEDYANDYKMTVKVNWAAIGTQDPEATMEFASNLQKAAFIAATSPLNGAKAICTK